MKKKTIAIKEAWWVWLGEESAIRVENESEARSLLLQSGKEYDICNSYNRSDCASPVAELLWNTPLGEGESFHKTVISPLVIVLHNKELRKVVYNIPPSKQASLFKGWYELEPELPAWIPNQYNAAINDVDCLIVKSKKPLIEQLRNKWPNI